MAPRKDFLVFGQPVIEQAEIDAVVQVLKSGWLGTGPRVAEFEKNFAAYKQVSEAAAVYSCTAALHLSLLAAGVGPGDEVITTPFTFCATINAIIHTGATPVLADIDPATQNIDPVRIQEKLSSKTKAILPVHYAGRSCRMDAIMDIAKSKNLKVIEDCAHAIETEFQGKPAGTFGDFSCFSFYVTKNLTTGEGGMVLAKEASELSKIRILRLHGISQDAWKRFGKEGYKHYEVVAAGFKQNMTDLLAAIGIEQLKSVDRYWKRRAEIWKAYDEGFKGLPIGLPAPIEADSRHGLHLYTIMIDPKKCGIARDAFLTAMQKRNIGVGVHYMSMVDQEFYRKSFGWNERDYPHGVQAGRQTLSLPLSAGLKDQDVADVVEAVRDCLKGA